MPLDEITDAALSPRCMRCMLDKYLDAVPEGTPWRERAAYMRQVLTRVATLSDHQTAPEISYELDALRFETFGTRRDLSAEKRHFNELVLSLEPELAKRIESSPDPLGLAIRMALTGNFIDFGPTGDVDETTLLKLLSDAAEMDLDEEALADLKRRITCARTIGYLTDNCGEVVLDKLLIEEIRRQNPGVEAVAVVRGAEVSNDATERDARQVGLHEVCEVISNGSDVAGTCPSRVNARTLAVLAESDLVISKGLANLETLSGKGRNTYFLFLCKCALYTEVFEVPLLTPLVVRGA